MDLPSFTTNPTTAAISPVQQTQPESVDSSPRSRIVECWEEGLSPVPGGGKVRLMCSYGGHIIPRPHSRSLFYVGGETRMVVADRHSSLADLSARLSRTLLNGRCFALKYQIPNEELDSLISVTTDEDLDNIIEEYDRATATASPLKPTRIRLFLFPAKPETATSMANLLDDTKSETWFVGALNCTGLLPIGLSDFANFDSLLNLDDPRHNHNNVGGDGYVVSNSNDHDHDNDNDSSLHTDLEAQLCHERTQHDKLVGATLSNNKLNSDHNVINGTSDSSFGSSSSSPSVLPLDKTRVDGGVPNNDGTKLCLDGQFPQLGISPTVRKQDDGISSMSSLSPHVPDVGNGENPMQVVSNNESSAQGDVQAGCRKTPLPLQHVPYNTGAFTANNLLHSPDSIASENSLASIHSLSTVVHHEPLHAGSRDSNNSASQNYPKKDVSYSNSQPQMQPAQESVYLLQPHLHQHQQYLQPVTHYIHIPGTGLVQVSPFYSMYAPPPLQQLHQRIDQHIPMQTMSLTKPQFHNIGVQENSGARRPSTPANAVLVAQAATNRRESIPPVYSTQKATGTPQLVQVSPNQNQPQYVGFSQLHNPAQFIAAAENIERNLSISSTADYYTYEYPHPGYEQACCASHPASMMPVPYQTMNQSSAVYFSEAAPSPLQHTENSK